MNALISVIVPVYNVEKYLRKCIDSILCQTYHNLEIILVDDGSTDDCGKICDEYAQADSRIQVIHQENAGLSDARNSGIDAVTGDYIFFIDSDDYISDDCIESLCSALINDNSECAITNHLLVDESTGYHKRKHNIHNKRLLLTTTEALNDLLYENHLGCSSWGKLFRTYLFKEIRFPKGILHEDEATTYLLFAKCSRITVIAEAKYYYLKRIGSIMNTGFSYDELIMLDIAEEMFNYINTNFPVCYEASVSKLIWVYFHIFFVLPDKGNSYRLIQNKIKKTIKKYRFQVLFNKHSSKNIRYACLLSYFGFGIVKIIGKRIRQ